MPTHDAFQKSSARPQSSVASPSSSSGSIEQYLKSQGATSFSPAPPTSSGVGSGSIEEYLKSVEGKGKGGGSMPGRRGATQKRKTNYTCALLFE